MSPLRNPYGAVRPRGLDTVPPFDVQGHRGAPGPVPGNTLPSFWRALALGATTLEVDVGVTRDGVVIASHERRATLLECVDARSPHLGRLWKELTFGEVRTLDRGAGGFATLDEVLRVAAGAGARVNVEAKLDPTAPADTWPPAFFARRLAEQLRRSGLVERCTVQSFDWRLLVAVKRLLPEVETIALAEASTLYRGSPWTAGFPVEIGRAHV